jgi:alpha-galactosidase
MYVMDVSKIIDHRLLVKTNSMIQHYKRINKILLTLLIIYSSSLFPQSYFGIDGNDILLNNGSLIRKIKFVQDSIYTYRFSIDEKEKAFVVKSKEFSFLLNDKIVDGFSGWKLLSTKKIKDNNSGSGICITIQGTKEWNNITLELNYLMYPDFALIRKWIKITNTSTNEIKIEAFNIEDLQTRLSDAHSVVYENYGRMKHLGHFVGNWDDPVIVVHDIRARRGLALGNEAPGIVKRTAFHTVDRNVEIGLTHPGQSYPFRKWLKPSESWESPKVFISLYKNSDDGFGWMRINFENNSGGIVGIFRQGALEKSRQVFLQDLNPDSTYIIRLAPDGKEVYRATGKKIMGKGVSCKN